MDAKERIENQIEELDDFIMQANDEDTIEFEKIKGTAITNLKDIEESEKAHKRELISLAVKSALGLVAAVVPIVISGIQYSKAQKTLLEFEETGRVNSKAGKELHLPKLL